MSWRGSVLSLLSCGLLLGCADERQPRRRQNDPPDPIQLSGRDWLQWGRTSDHMGAIDVVGQPLDRILADIEVDANVEAQKAETGGYLLTHYQVPLALSGQEVLVAFQAGTFVSCSPPGSGEPAPCGAAAWNQQIWSQRMLRWNGDNLATAWSFTSDWKPVPAGGEFGSWEPVFHAAIHGDFVYVPAAGGSVDKLHRSDGSLVTRIEPFGGASDTFATGPIAVDGAGRLYYNAIRFDMADPWRRDVLGAWLVRVAADDSATTVSFASLVPGAPAPAALCRGSFSSAELPWPPSPSAVPPSFPCGSQRPGLNVAPAVAASGVVCTVSRAHFNSRYGYVVAVNSDLTPRWAASLRGRLNDGCGSPLLPASQPGACRPGAPFGVDPATNEAPAGRVSDAASSSPTVAPDGSVLYGAFTRYNGSRGHLMKFGPGGRFQASYDFGWDTTPAIYEHDGTFSVVIKDNHYPAGSYCSDPVHCPPRPAGPYDITQLSAGLQVEWTCTNTETRACARDPDGSMSCSGHHPGGFEWCINAPVVDATGAVYANAEDGFLYVMDQGGIQRQRIFLDVALGAAYTPLSIDAEGRVYTQNNGRLFVVGQ